MDGLAAWTRFARTDLAERSVRQYRYWLLRFEADAEIDPLGADADEVLEFLATIGPRGPAVSSAKRALRHFYRWAAATKRRADDPSLGLPRTRRQRRVPAFLTEAELTRLIYAAAQHKEEWAWGFLFVYGTGARIGEACSLKAKDVDLAAGVVVFRGTKGGGDRLVHLSSPAHAAASALLRRNGTDTLLGIAPAGMRARMTKVGMWARLPPGKLHPHTLRHTAGTMLSERGADARAVMDFLGHVDPGMVWVYQRVTSDRAKKVAGLL